MIDTVECLLQVTKYDHLVAKTCSHVIILKNLINNCVDGELLIQCNALLMKK